MHSRPRWIAAVGVSAVVLGAGLSGCSSPDTSSANTQMCGSLDAARGELQTLKVMLTTGVATVEQVQDQVSDVRNSVAAIQLTGQEAAQAAVRELQQHQATFDKAIKDIPSNATVSEAKEAYRAAIADYNTSVQATAAKLGCTTSS